MVDNIIKSGQAPIIIIKGSVFEGHVRNAIARYLRRFPVEAIEFQYAVAEEKKRQTYQASGPHSKPMGMSKAGGLMLKAIIPPELHNLIACEIAGSEIKNWKPEDGITQEIVDRKREAMAWTKDKDLLNRFLKICSVCAVNDAPVSR